MKVIVSVRQCAINDLNLDRSQLELADERDPQFEAPLSGAGSQLQLNPPSNSPRFHS